MARVCSQAHLARPEHLLEGADPTGVLGEGDDDATALRAAWREVDAAIPGRGRTDEVIEGDVERPGEGEQQIERRLPVARLEAGERAYGQAGAIGERGERPAA